ncbi:MAG: hypothetical protein HS110_12850 [Zoogloeaceae bacterium]|nr:hypothetical protein [Zoogloeaceae bacterium]MCK6383113.1 hypothetical protein [Rhodocyclaceae bacterium]
MNPRDPNLAKVELIAHVLGALREDLVFVGGCAVGLLMTDPAAAPARVTYDVDMVVEVATLRDYHRMEEKFAAKGFARDMVADAPICRWRYREIEVDLMPTAPGILGFSNRWYPLAMTTAEKRALPGGVTIRLIAAPLFLATKFEAFADRGAEDLLGSHDLEDIINVVDGRPELSDEIARADDELRAYLSGKCASLLAMPNFMNYLPGLVIQDATLPERVAELAARLQRIACTNKF